jgi:hypothetical protein
MLLLRILLRHGTLVDRGINIDVWLSYLVWHSRIYDLMLWVKVLRRVVLHSLHRIVLCVALTVVISLIKIRR